MQNHEIAAHQIADALAAIHRAMPTATPEVRETMRRLFALPTSSDVDCAVDHVVGLVRATAPFAPVPDAQKDTLRENTIDMLSDCRTREIVDEHLPSTEWQWRDMADDHRATMVEDGEMSEDELAEWDAAATE